MQHGLGLKLKLELEELRQRHRLPPPVLSVEDSLPDCDDDLVVLSGYAATFDVDAERMKFRPSALRWSTSSMPDLRWRHGAESIGTVDQIEHTDCGLRVSVTTAHPLAKNAGAFSVCASVRDYVLRNVDSPDFYAEILDASIDEISLTPQPANKHALVMERMPARHPLHERNMLMLKWVGLMQQLVQLGMNQGAIR
jgi:hypothetical protein